MPRAVQVIYTMRAKSFRETKSLREVSDKLLSKLQCNGLSIGSFVLSWKEIIGKEYATVCLPYKIYTDKKNNSIQLKVVSENLFFISTFSHHQDTLNKRVMRYFGLDSNTFKGVKLVKIY